MPMKNPPHPGDFTRTEIIKPAGLSVTAAASALQVSRPALSSCLAGMRAQDLAPLPQAAIAPLLVSRSLEANLAAE
jgi:hypothetical protein